MNDSLFKARKLIGASPQYWKVPELTKIRDSYLRGHAEELQKIAAQVIGRMIQIELEDELNKLKRKIKQLEDQLDD